MATTKPMRAEDLLEFHDDYRYDLIRGELYRMSPAGGEHGALAGRFAAYAGGFIVRHDLGNIYVAETGFILRRDPDTLVAPDVAFVRRDRVPAGRDHRGFLEIIPDLALEVVSPSDSARLVRDKIQEYRDAGTPLLIVMELDHRETVVYRAGHEPIALGIDDVLDIGDALPGFQLPLKALFA